MGGYLRKMMRSKIRASGGLLKRMTRDHEDVLQTIEFVLVRAYRQFPDVDDRAAHDALTAVLTAQPARAARVAAMVAGLDRVRQMRSDISDGTWTDALKVVAESIRRHSDLSAGATDYFDFVCMFMP